MMPAEAFTMADHALAYAAKGLEVFPCKPNKAPYIDGGMNAASSDTGQVMTWWCEFPNALIGCRIPADMVVLDIDPRHGGLDTWNELVAHFGEPQMSRQHFSGREDGGFHVWFQRPEGRLSIRRLTDWAKANKVGAQVGKSKWTSGIDVLHHGHRYSILPPSLHSESGRPYRWENDGDPSPCPPPIAALITADDTPKEQPKLRVVKDADSIADWYTANHTWNEILSDWFVTHGDGDSDGSRWRHPNASADWSASIKNGCLFVYTDNTDFEQTGPNDVNGYTRFRAYAMLEHDGDLKAAARAAFEMRDGVQASPTANHVDPTELMAGPIPANAVEWPELIPLGETRKGDPFPLDMLPAWVREYVQMVADELQVPVDLPATLAIAALSTIAGGRLKIFIGSSWREQANLYLVVSMPPGSGKSPAFKLMLSPIYEIEAQLQEDAKGRNAHLEQSRRMVEKAMKKAEDKNDQVEARVQLEELLALDHPVEPTLIADDITPEALEIMLADQGGRLAILSPEGGLFDMMTGRYSERANLDVYLKAWAGDDIRTNRVGRSAAVVANPALTVGLTVQPSVIAALAERPELAGRGLTARFMYSVPVDLVGDRDMTKERQIDQTITAAYVKQVKELDHKLKGWSEEATLTPEARTKFNAWRHTIELRRKPDGDLRPLSEWTTKLESSVARMAGLLWMADGMNGAVDASTMERAITIGRYWMSHAFVVHGTWGTDPMVSKARRIVDWVRAKQLTEFTVRKLYTDLNAHFPRAEDTVEPLRLLTERGYLVVSDGHDVSAMRRGRPSPLILVSTKVHDVMSSAGHAGHAVRDVKSEISISLYTDTNTRPHLHDLHDLHDPKHPNTTKSGRSELDPINNPADRNPANWNFIDDEPKTPAPYAQEPT